MFRVKRSFLFAMVISIRGLHFQSLCFLSLCFLNHCSVAHCQDAISKPTLQWIEDLESDSYATRMRASEQLLRYFLRNDATETEIAQELRAHLSANENDSAANQRLQEIYSKLVVERSIGMVQEFGGADFSPAKHAFPGWDTFTEMAGDGWETQQYFRQIMLRHEKKLRTAFGADRGELSTIGWKLNRVNRRDDVTWTTLLLLTQSPQSGKMKGLSWQLISVLRHPELGPDEASLPPTLHRMIGWWLQHEADVGFISDRLIAARRYRCDTAAIEISEKALCDPTLPAVSHAVAILSLVAIESQNRLPLGATSKASRLLDDSTKNLLLDTRRCHLCWDTFAGPRILTRMQDVALAAQLHREGYDPRKFGFDRLCADPFTLFRLDSLGFENDSQRQAAFSLALGVLGSEEGDE